MFVVKDCQEQSVGLEGFYPGERVRADDNVR